MKKRILLLTTLAAMLAAAMALSGVAQAAPISDKADVQCLKLAIKTLPSFNPAHYTFHGGTEDIDNFTDDATLGNDVFCGFGGDDLIFALDEGDIFLGGAGNDFVVWENFGTFYGGADNDRVEHNRGTFYGEEGGDEVFNNFPGATFYGGGGTDAVIFNYTGATFVQD